jgi:hypothetical protein
VPAESKKKKNRAHGTRDIGGKAAREAASECGQRASFKEGIRKKEEERSETDSNENLAFRQAQPDLHSSILNEIKFQNW